MEKKKILIIEDDKSLVSILRGAIDLEKFGITLALEAQEGIEKAILEHPDLIVLDILLPGQSGFECLQILKERKETRNIPVIILSNLGQEEEIRKGLELGAVDYLVKADYSIDKVINKITKTIKK